MKVLNILFTIYDSPGLIYDNCKKFSKCCKRRFGRRFSPRNLEQDIWDHLATRKSFDGEKNVGGLFEAIYDGWKTKLRWHNPSNSYRFPNPALPEVVNHERVVNVSRESLRNIFFDEPTPEQQRNIEWAREYIARTNSIYGGLGIPQSVIGTNSISPSNFNTIRGSGSL